MARRAAAGIGDSVCAWRIRLGAGCVGWYLVGK